MLNLNKPPSGSVIVICIESTLRDDRWQHRVDQLITNGFLSTDTKTISNILHGIANSWTQPDETEWGELSQTEARDKLSAEWLDRAPSTPEEIAEFYRTSKHIERDLRAWHSTPARQRWTEIVVDVAKQCRAQIAVDIGCGAGHELIALRAAGVPELYGVEPNERLRQRVQMHTPCVASIDQDRIPIEQADLLVCLDVLEHVVDPESFLGTIAGWAKENCVLVESTATFDHGTPLHLEANHGWHPTQCLESHGFELLEASNRVKVWQKVSKKA